VDTLVDVHVEIERVVAAGDTAEALGSGDVPVLGTPRLIAWLEAAAVAALDGRLPLGATSVGTRIAVDHRTPSAIGDVVRVEAHLVRQEGRAVDFAVRARSSAGDVIAEGTVGRVIVDRARFLG
jgi:fluoroacetyl-CoA thioesterase